MAHSVEDILSPPPAEPAPSAIAGRPEGNVINIGSDDAESTKKHRSPAEEDRPPPSTLLPAAESQLGLNSRPPSPSPPSPKPPEATGSTLKEEYEKRSKTKHDKKAPSQHVAAICSEGQPATSDIGVGLPTTTNNTNAGNTSLTNIASNSAAELRFSRKTVGNTDSDSAAPAVSHSEPTPDTDAPVSAAASGNPAQPRALTRQDYACLDSSEAQSDDSHLTRDSITRESQNDELSSSTLEKLDVSTLPLPALPKRRRTRSRTSPSKHLQQRQQQQQQRHEAVEDVTESPEAAVQQPLKTRQRAVTPESQKNASEISTPKKNTSAQKQQRQQQQQQASQAPPHLSAFQQYVAKRRESLEASNRSFNEKLEARRMHYHHMGGGSANGSSAASHLTAGSNGVPTYLFGEHFHGRNSMSPGTTKEEIFLNKSGWVQVNTKRGSGKDDNCEGYRRLNYGQQNGGGRPAIRGVPMDHGRRSDLARQSFVQQHQQPPSGMGISEPKFVGSKVEELIQRNEARLGGYSSREAALRPGYRIIDPQLANILNERPGFLPVKSPNDLDSPITPILSPPPAFQDNSRSVRLKPMRSQGPPLPLPVPLQSQTQLVGQHPANVSVKGMVFSRSFEYDTRRPQPPDNYVETFSRSFDGNLSERPLNLAVLAGQRERSPNFSTLTGNSPNYLTKRESGGGSSGSLRSRDNSPKYLNPHIAQTTAYLNAAVKEAPPVYSVAAATGSQAKYSPRSRHERTAERAKTHALGRSRKSQFSRVGSAGPLVQHPAAPSVGVSRFRSFDTSKSQRLNSCDSGARSDLSNDEVDNEDGGLSEFLSAGTHKFPKAGASTVSISPFKMQRQRSLTPDRNESHSSSTSLRKQRSLTPESRSLTPEERRKKGSQLSLSAGSRQNSGSRSNTLEARKDKTPPNISRSSSSSSYSGGDSHEPLNASTSSTVTASVAGPASSSSSHRRAMAAKQAEQEHRIRRSRSLQLSERSPNRTHKSIVNLGAVSVQQQHQASAGTYQQSRLPVGGGVFPPTIRASPAPASSSTSVRVRQSEADKARSFDFDYSNYNRSGGSKGSARSAHTSGSGGDSGSNQNLRVERESRSFDDDYREAVLNNNNGSLRFLQPAADTSHPSSSRLRKSNSPVEHSAASRSPQSSGSSSNNLHQASRQTGSPQSYGTRLCDHELTYDMLRKSPIMNFRRGDSSDYELPVMLRNRETINSGGNSELNFMSNETRIYEHPTTVLKPQRSLRQSPGSRDDLTLEMAVGVGGDYIYRQAATQPRSSRY
nr:uncharacterized protein LOC108079021 [Drosophila kikkawai]